MYCIADDMFQHSIWNPIIGKTKCIQCITKLSLFRINIGCSRTWIICKMALTFFTLFYSIYIARWNFKYRSIVNIALGSKDLLWYSLIVIVNATRTGNCLIWKLYWELVSKGSKSESVVWRCRKQPVLTSRCIYYTIPEL